MNEIIKGAISNVSYKDAYDDEGAKYKNYTFTIDGKKLNCKLPRLEHLTDGEVMIVEYKKTGTAYEMVSGLHTLRNYKWGNTSNLKAHKGEADNFTFVEGKIIEKRRLQMVKSNASIARRDINYTIVLENTDFNVPEYIAEKLKSGDNVSAVLSDNFASLVYNKTNNKWLGVKSPYYIAIIGFAISLTAVIYYLHTIGNKTFVKPVTTAVIFDVMALWFGLVNFFSYRHSKAAKRLLNDRMNKQV